jgi:hypothetical protein
MVRPDVSRRQSSRVGPPSFFHFYADGKRQNSALAFGFERNSGWTVVFEPWPKTVRLASLGLPQREHLREQRLHFPFAFG